VKQRAAIYRWRPWDNSTGPKSREGKARVSRNALKHGNRSAQAIAKARAFRDLIDQISQG
jgi:hypothetical protein